MAKLNDGKGLYDSEGVCDKGILLCNAALKDLIDGQYLLFVNKLEQVAQIFANLKTAIKDERADLEGKIEELKKQLRSAGQHGEEMTLAEYIERYGKDGATNGGNYSEHGNQPAQ